jgi:hypothetical protein
MAHQKGFSIAKLDVAEARAGHHGSDLFGSESLLERGAKTIQGICANRIEAFCSIERKWNAIDAQACHLRYQGYPGEWIVKSRRYDLRNCKPA